MLAWIREKFGTAVIGTIISLIAFVFIFYGVFSPKATRGLHEGAVAGTVNGDSISIAEFNREVNRRMEFLKSLRGGQQIDDALTKQIRGMVFQDLANRRLMIQEAERKGLLASDEEVREKIREIPAFQKDGKFDVLTYKQVLESNNYTVGSFERMMREDVSLSQWESYFKDRVHVSDEEVKREFLMSQDRRNLKYVLLSPEMLQKAVDPLKDLKKDPEKNPKKDAIPSEKAKDVKPIDPKILEKTSDDLLAAWNANPATEAKLNALLKRTGSSVKSTGWVNRQNTYIPGIGEIKDVLKDAFASPSPIDPKQNGKAKKYALGDRILIAWVTDSQKPDLSQLDRQRDHLMEQLSRKKAASLYQEWMKKLTSKAKIEMNPTVVGAESQ